MNQNKLSASKKQQQQLRHSKTSKNDKEYEVEAILEKRVNRKDVSYLVKWKGYGNRYNEWISKENLGKCTRLIKSFEGEYKSKRKAPASAATQPPAPESTPAGAQPKSTASKPQSYAGTPAAPKPAESAPKPPAEAEAADGNYEDVALGASPPPPTA